MQLRPCPILCHLRGSSVFRIIVRSSRPAIALETPEPEACWFGLGCDPKCIETCICTTFCSNKRQTVMLKISCR